MENCHVFFHIIELRISNNFSISISISIFTFLHFYKCYARIFYCNSRAGMIQFIRLTECSTRGSALVLRSIQLLDDEDQIAREPVFRAERIPERIDRPMPRIHIRGLSAFCLKVIFTACCRRHALFFIRLFLPDSWQLNAFYFLFGTITLSQCPDH